MDIELLRCKEVDRLLRYPYGKTGRLAKAGKIPYIRLPDGGIRIRKDDIETLLEARQCDGKRVVNNG